MEPETRQFGSLLWIICEHALEYNTSTKIDHLANYPAVVIVRESLSTKGPWKKKHTGKKEVSK
jgi:hypothetical protein